jgi:molecular chaperone DnaK (HSP70)
VLSYVEGEEYYGNQAKNFLVRNASNTIAFFPEFIGQEWVFPRRVVLGLSGRASDHTEPY